MSVLVNGGAVSSSPSAAAPIPSSVQVVTRDQAWRMWRLPALVIIVGMGGVLMFAAYRFGPLTMLGGLILLWPAYVLLVALTVVGIVSLEFMAEPPRLEISDHGIAFPGRVHRQSWAWSQLNGPAPSVLGVFLRRKVPAFPSLPAPFRRLQQSGKGEGIVPSPNQWQAILSHPSCPRWELSDQTRRQMGICPRRT